jgi:hypothetical protein
MSCGLNLKDNLGSSVLIVFLEFFVSGIDELKIYALVSSDCGLDLYWGLFFPTVFMFFKKTP